MGPWRAFPSRVTINGYMFSSFFCFEVSSSFSIPISKPERRNRNGSCHCVPQRKKKKKTKEKVKSCIKPPVGIQKFWRRIPNALSWSRLNFSLLSSVVSVHNYSPILESSNCFISLDSCSSFTHASSRGSNGKLTSSFGIGYPGRKKDEKRNSWRHQGPSLMIYLGHVAAECLPPSQLESLHLGLLTRVSLLF